MFQRNNTNIYATIFFDKDDVVIISQDEYIPYRAYFAGRDTKEPIIAEYFQYTLGIDIWARAAGWLKDPRYIEAVDDPISSYNSKTRYLDLFRKYTGASLAFAFEPTNLRGVYTGDVEYCYIPACDGQDFSISSRSPGVRTITEAGSGLFDYSLSADIIIRHGPDAHRRSGYVDTVCRLCSKPIATGCFCSTAKIKKNQKTPVVGRVIDGVSDNYGRSDSYSGKRKNSTTTVTLVYFRGATREGPSLEQLSQTSSCSMLFVYRQLLPTPHVRIEMNPIEATAMFLLSYMTSIHVAPSGQAMYASASAPHSDVEWVLPVIVEGTNHISRLMYKKNHSGVDGHLSARLHQGRPGAPYNECAAKANGKIGFDGTKLMCEWEDVAEPPCSHDCRECKKKIKSAGLVIGFPNPLIARVFTQLADYSDFINIGTESNMYKLAMDAYYSGYPLSEYEEFFQQCRQVAADELGRIVRALAAARKDEPLPADSYY